MTQLPNSTLKVANGKGHIRILHADDDPSILDISKQILMDMGNFEFDNAYCVDEAFKKQATVERGNNLRPTKKSTSRQLGKA